jgi:hypothetical protein
MRFTNRELGAVLAGLRLLDGWLLGQSLQNQGTYDMVIDIMGDSAMPMINDLCVRLNTAPNPPEWAFDIVMQLAEQNIAPTWDDDLAALEPFRQDMRELDEALRDLAPYLREEL